jgi:hypothetical protein
LRECGADVRRAKNTALCGEKTIRGNAQRSVVVEAQPTLAFIVIEADLTFELLIITLNAPTSLRVCDELMQRSRFREVGEPVFSRLVVIRWPLDKKPFCWPNRMTKFIAMCDADTHCRKP